jgi:predicted nucleic acid-binding protein
VILVDSSVWIDYFNGTICPRTDRLDALLGVEPIGLGDIILAEVLQGFRDDEDYETAKELLLSLPIFDLLGRDMAIRSAANFRWLRSRGITIRKTVDVVIATFCIERGFPLLHADRGFEPFHRHLGLPRALSLV